METESAGTSMRGLDRAVSIVTGASGGIGGAIAEELAGHGGRLVLTGRRIDQLEHVARTVRQRGGEAVTIAGDISRPETAERLVRTAIDRYGTIDLLVNNAGFGPPMPVAALSESVWDATIGSCLKGPYLMCRSVIPVMLAAGAGRIIQVSSIAGKVAEANRSAYCAAKWGLHGFTAALQQELASSNVRVHLLCPAGVATDWWANTGDPQPAAVLDRMMVPADIARAVVWLATQPDHVHVGELVLHNARPPWQAGSAHP